MALSIFVDALPYNEIRANYNDWFDDMQVAELLPNIAYSSSLHWQLYCDKYPDDRGILVDWKKSREDDKKVRILSTLLLPCDYLGNFGLAIKKSFDKFIFRKNTFANIPLKFRNDFSEKAKYLFWDKKTYTQEPVFKDYVVVSQDEGHLSFERVVEKYYEALNGNNPNIFFVTCFADSIGHKVRRGPLYSERIKPCMNILHDMVVAYQKKYPNEEILIASDHGMSTILNHVDYPFDELFGTPSKKTYIKYTDSCLMSLWVKDPILKKKMEDYLREKPEGHLLTEEDRIKYRATNLIFGDIIYILREGYSFANSWFGKSLRKPNPDGTGMHGFWPERSAKDQMATIILISGKRSINEFYTYPEAYKLINSIMQPK